MPDSILARRLRVKAAGESDWKKPQPLLALKPGDQLQVQGDARVVVLFHAGGGTKAITPENSPFAIAAPAPAAANDQIRTVIARVVQFLLGKQDPPQDSRLRTLGSRLVGDSGVPAMLLTGAPLIVSPRNTRLFPGRPTFEWEGSDKLQYTLRVIGPEGVVWEKENPWLRSVKYPWTPWTTPLTPGVPYHWELKAQGWYPEERSQFEILTDAEAARIREALAALDRAEGYSSGTLIVMRAALLFEEGLYDEARRKVEAAVAAQPDEPNLRFLQGHVYQRIGLNGKAAEAFDRAKALMR